MMGAIDKRKLRKSYMKKNEQDDNDKEVIVSLAKK